jgi:hypothetical protein
MTQYGGFTLEYGIARHDGKKQLIVSMEPGTWTDALRTHNPEPADLLIAEIVIGK